MKMVLMIVLGMLKVVKWIKIDTKRIKLVMGKDYTIWKIFGGYLLILFFLALVWGMSKANCTNLYMW